MGKIKRSKIYILFVISVLTVVAGVQLINLFHQYNEKEGEAQALREKIRMENEKNLQLKEYEQYMQSDEKGKAEGFPRTEKGKAEGFSRTEKGKTEGFRRSKGKDKRLKKLDRMDNKDETHAKS